MSLPPNSKPILNVALAAGRLITRNSQVDVTWKNAFPSPICETLKVIFCDDEGNRQLILATGVDNLNRAGGSVRVLMPNYNLPKQKWIVRVSSEQNDDIYADSEPFMLLP